MQHGDDRLTRVTRLEDLDGQVFDVINLEQVLEHTRSPLDTLKSVLAYIHDRSVLRITVPRVDSSSKGMWDRFPFDGKAPHIMSPYEHLHGFTAKSLVVLLGRVGFVRIGHLELLRTHAGYVARQMIGEVLPQLKQTMALVESTQIRT